MTSTKLLIAEDNIQFLHTMQDYLKKLMIEIISVTDGVVALEIVKRYRPDLIILDLNMPRLNGIEFLNKLEEFSDLSSDIIIVSGEKEFINKIPSESYKLIKKIFCKPVELEDVSNNIKYILLNKEKEDDIIRVQEVLEIFNFNKSSKGYKLLIECFNEIISQPEGLNSIEKVVYKKVAHKHGFNKIDPIKWCIFKTIKSMIRFTDAKILNKYFWSSDNITPKSFMFTIYNISKSKKDILELRG